MRVLGVLLFLGGLLGLWIAFAMDTTVATEFGRVHNIGLMSQRTNYLIVSGIITLVGVLLLGFGEVIYQRTPKTRCPACNGGIEGQPKLCQHCQSEINWEYGSPITPEQAEIEREYDAENDIAELEKEVLRSEQRARRAENQAAAMATASRGLAATWAAAIKTPGKIDTGLRKAVGEDNVIVYRFIQIVFYFALPAAILVILVANL